MLASDASHMAWASRTSRSWAGAGGAARPTACGTACGTASTWVAVLGFSACALLATGARAQAAPSAREPAPPASAHEATGKAKAAAKGGTAPAGERGDRAKAKGEEGEHAKKGRRRSKGCPSEMASIQGRFCIDRWEAHTVEVGAGGQTRKHSPYESVANLKVRAKSAAGRVPQGYISRDEAEQACKNAGKRLCTDEEWLTACKGKKPTAFPYGDEWQARRCNDQGVSSFNHFYGGDGQPPPQSAYSWENMNDPRLNQLEGTVASSGKFKRCRNSYGVYDMVGNLHEWTAAPSGTFRGGYYLDVHQNGEGCDYRTRAHGPRYHDYSTGFRCCK
jgi:sulfatase modifying factor 1